VSKPSRREAVAAAKKLSASEDQDVRAMAGWLLDEYPDDLRDLAADVARAKQLLLSNIVSGPGAVQCRIDYGDVSKVLGCTNAHGRLVVEALTAELQGRDQ